MIDTQSGQIVGQHPESGDQPHENNFSRDGKLVYHASIGTVFTPPTTLRSTPARASASSRSSTRATGRCSKQDRHGQEAGRVRRARTSAARCGRWRSRPDERYVYFQVSFFHGFVEYDLQQDRVLRVAHLPVSEEAQRQPREDYLLDSAHHGLAMNPAGTKLCAAGTMSDYAAIVDRAAFAHTVIPVGQKPYWATNSGDGTAASSP